MKNIFLLLSFYFFSLTAFSQQSLVETKQIDLGYILPSDSLSIYIEYPEYAPLSTEEKKVLLAQNFEPSEQVSFQVNRTISRGRTIADIVFIPVVKQGNRWKKIVRYDLRAETKGVKEPMRSVIRSASKVAAASRYASHSVLSQGKWVKISVSKEGIYQLSDSQLSSMGFSDPSRVKLYGYGGRLLPDVLSFTGNDALIDDLCEVPLYRRNGSLLFFAEGLTRWESNTRFQINTFSQYSYYFLTEGDSPTSFPQLNALSVQAEDVTEATAHALYKEDAYVWYGGGRDFYDSNDTQGGHNFTLSLPGHSNGEVTVAYDVSAQSATSSVSFTITQRSTSSKVASGTISAYGDGESARGYRNTFKATFGETETFQIETSADGHLGYLYCAYPQQISTSYTTSAFTTEKTGSINLKVSDANENTRVWQLDNNPSSIAELYGVLNGTTYTAQAEEGTSRFILVDISKTYDSPNIIGQIDNQDLHADSTVDYVIIVPASGKLTSEAERLAEAHRAKSGLSVRVVKADQIYNEFSSGTPDATAYRRYLKMLYDRSSDSDKPKYLLLFGDCAYDNRMITSEWKNESPDDYLLANERNDQETTTSYSIGTLHSYVTDDIYALLDDSEGTSPISEKIDLGVGRFLAHTAEDAQWLTDQAIDYLNNEHTGVWKNRMWVLGDTGDNNSHMNDAEDVAKQVAQSADSAFFLRKIYPDAYSPTYTAKGKTYPEATNKLLNAMQQGALIFNYNGHGSPDRISHKFLLTKEQIAENTSEHSRPLWIFASCEITPYDQQISDLGRNALYDKQGPAIAVLCSSRSVYSNWNRSLNKGFIKYAFSKTNGKRNTFGDALRLAKVELVTSQGNTIGTDRTINKMKYALLGDPALVLDYPEPNIEIDSVNAKAVSETNLMQIPIGGKARFTGFVSDSSTHSVDNSFNGILTASVFAPKQTITCKGDANSSADPLTYTDYTRTIFEGSVEVKNGKFVIEFIVPRGITFSTDQALLSLYAVSNDTEKRESAGQFTHFCFNGSAESEEADTLGPAVYLYLNTPDFPDGGVVGTNATFYASVKDSTALSMVSGNIGHDMEMWLDNDASTTTTLNDWFAFEYDSYKQGLVTYPLTDLQAGRHLLSFRAWDVFDNSTTTSLAFVVKEDDIATFDVYATQTNDGTSRFVTTFVVNETADKQVVTEVFNIWGQRVWHGTTTATVGNSYASIDWAYTDYAGRKLPSGVYLYRSIVGNEKTKAKKVAIIK